MAVKDLWRRPAARLIAALTVGGAYAALGTYLNKCGDFAEKLGAIDAAGYTLSVLIAVAVAADAVIELFGRRQDRRHRPTPS